MYVIEVEKSISSCMHLCFWRVLVDHAVCFGGIAPLKGFEFERRLVISAVHQVSIRRTKQIKGQDEVSISEEITVRRGWRKAMKEDNRGWQ